MKKDKLKFNNYVKTFPHKLFGDLTVIKSHKEEDTYWFVGKEIQNILGFQNLTQAINQADLDYDEILFIDKKTNEKVFNDFISHYENKGPILKIEPSTNPILSKYSNSVTLIKESGLYGLAMASRKPIARDFRRAIRKDVLPAVRKLFEKINNVELKHDIIAHLDIEYQKFNSKYYNSLSYGNGGKNKTIYNNWEMSMRHTNISPSKWKKDGKERAVELGIPPSRISSGLDGMRLLKPEESCSISQHKELVRFGLDDSKAFAISNSDIAKSHYKLLSDNNIIPNELLNN